jgi:hypothetical protein
MRVPSKALCQLISGVPCCAGSNERVGLAKPKDICVLAMSCSECTEAPLRLSVIRARGRKNLHTKHWLAVGR